MTPFFVRITRKNRPGEFRYLVFAADGKQAIHIAKTFGAHEDRDAFAEPLTVAYEMGAVDKIVRL